MCWGLGPDLSGQSGEGEVGEGGGGGGKVFCLGISLKNSNLILDTECDPGVPGKRIFCVQKMLDFKSRLSETFLVKSNPDEIV